MLGFCKIFVYFYLVIVYDGGDDGGDDDVIYGDYGDVIFYVGNDVCNDDDILYINKRINVIFVFVMWNMYLKINFIKNILIKKIYFCIILVKICIFVYLCIIFFI